MSDVVRWEEKATPEEIAWVNALESGDYVQGRRALHNVGTGQMCCLGVRMELDLGEGKVERSNPEEVIGEADQVYLYREVTVDDLFIWGIPGIDTLNRWGLPYDVAIELAELNDSYATDGFRPIVEKIKEWIANR
jgi:hypothetical protein